MNDEQNKDPEREAEEAEQGFKVLDKRRFDADGNRTESAGESSVAEEKPLESIEESKQAVGMSDAQMEGAAPEITFSSFVMSLATQTLMQLGEIPAPDGVEIPVDLTGARQTIDIISLLEEKTKGNLTENEDQLMSEVLHNLRITFVKHQGS